MLLLSSFTLFVVVAVANADDLFEGSESKRVIKLGQSFQLYCNVTKEPVKWFKDDSEIFAAEKLTIDPVNNALYVSRSSAKDGGDYECRSSEDIVVKKFEVAVEPHVKFPAKSVNAIGGEKFELKCDASGHPKPVLSWTKNELPIDLTNATSRYSFGADENELSNAVLKIEMLEESDAGDYACFAFTSSLDVTANSTVLIRVKDKWAAVYPFLGIVLEVIILVSIIFFYEKRRSKERLAEEDDQGKEKNAVNNKDSDVRQRK